jgi:hypothetical protein
MSYSGGHSPDGGQPAGDIKLLLHLFFFFFSLFLLGDILYGTEKFNNFAGFIEYCSGFGVSEPDFSILTIKT